MKKQPILALPIAAILFLTGCGTANSTEKNSSKNAASAADSSASTKTVYAEVVDVIGNQLSLDVLTGSFDLKETQERMEQMQSRMAEFSRPEGASGGRAVESGDESGRTFVWEPQTNEAGEPISRVPRTDENGQPLARVPRTNEAGEAVTVPDRYTGEKTEVIVPVGTPIEIISMKNFTLETKEGELADIKNGSVINLIYQDESKLQKLQIIEVGMGGFGGGMRTFGGPGGSGDAFNGIPGELPPGAQVQELPDGGVLVRVGE